MSLGLTIANVDEKVILPLLLLLCCWFLSSRSHKLPSLQSLIVESCFLVVFALHCCLLTVCVRVVEYNATSICIPHFLSRSYINPNSPPAFFACTFSRLFQFTGYSASIRSAYRRDFHFFIGLLFCVGVCHLFNKHILLGAHHIVGYFFTCTIFVYHKWYPRLGT